MLAKMPTFDHHFLRPDVRAVFWIKAAHKEFRKFPRGARITLLRALNVAAEGSKSDIAKPMKGLGPGVFEIALGYRSDAYRVVYAVKLDVDVWVVHVFRKKSTKGIKTPKREIDLIRSRIGQIKEKLR